MTQLFGTMKKGDSGEHQSNKFDGKGDSTGDLKIMCSEIRSIT